MSNRSEKWDKAFNKLWDAIRDDDPAAPEMIRREAAAGYPVNYTNGYGEILLRRAAKFNRPDCSQTLLELGVNPNLRALDGRTAFFIACDWGYIDCTKALVDAGVDWSIPHENGTLPLDRIRGTKMRAGLEEYIKARMEKQKAERRNVEINPSTEIEISW